MIKYLSGACFFILILASCKKENADFYTASINDYYPLEIGKYITYNLDSTVTNAFGTEFLVKSYQAQERVEAAITDNLGREGFRVNRYIRKDSTEDWTPNIVLMVIPTRNTLEYYENNLHYIKLMEPIRQDVTWKGNSYIDTYSNDLGVTYLDDWDYTYDSVYLPFTINSLNIDSTITIHEQDESVGDPSDPATSYADKTFSVEKYAKHIGLIYREFLHWEYQATPGRTPYYVGYGIKMTIIDHN